MRIGFDFDNTIVSYDTLFHKAAVEQSLIPVSLQKSKLAVRDYLLKINNENAWTELQGCVYGARMNEAAAYPNAIEFMTLAHDNGISMVIISHRSRYPFIGQKYNLHEAAREWVERYLMIGAKKLFKPDQIFFEFTKEEKINRISEKECDYFIDDLPEIFLMPGFPQRTGRILFDPDNSHGEKGVETRLKSWQKIRAFFEVKWKTCS